MRRFFSRPGLASIGASLGSVGALAQSPIGFGWRGLASLGAIAQCPIGFVWRRLASLGALAQTHIGFVRRLPRLTLASFGACLNSSSPPGKWDSRPRLFFPAEGGWATLSLLRGAI